MNAAIWGAAVGNGLIMFLFALIFLGLLALIPALKQPYGLRHFLAWLLATLLIGYVSAAKTVIWPLVLGSLLCGALMGGRYWWTTRKSRKAEGA